MKVIGLAGQLRNGKDVIADYVASKLGWDRGAFASSVKRVFCDTFDVDMDFIEEWKTKSECPPGFDMPVRQSLQFIGDGFRKIQGNIWIELAFRGRTNPVCLSDIRYVNELEKIHSIGGINILVYRPGYLNDDPNGSEAQIRPYVEYFMETGLEGVISVEVLRAVDRTRRLASVCENLIDVFLINDGTLEDLYRKIDDYVLPYVHEHFKKTTG